MTTQHVIPLTKGVPIRLAKPDGSAVSLKSVHVGCGWDSARQSNVKHDLDLSFILLADSKSKNLVTQSDVNPGIVFYNLLKSACGSIVLDKDNRDGSGDGYDENGNLNLETLPPEIGCIMVLMSIHDEKNLGITFGQVENAYVDVNVDGMDSLKIDLTEDHAASKAVNVAEIYRHDGGWRVKKIDLGFDNGLEEVLQSYGAKTE